MKISVLAEVGATTKSTTRVEEGTKLVDSSALNLQRWRILFALLLLAGQAAKAQRSERWTVETVRIERAGADGVHNLRCSSDGTYLLAGHTTSLEGDRDMAIFRLDRELRLDPSFGSSGVFTLGGSGDDQFADVCEWRDASGRLQGYYALGQYAAGDGDFSDLGNAGGIDLALVRLTPLGQLDVGFGEGGILALGGSNDDEAIVHLHNYSEPGMRLQVDAASVVLIAMTRSSDGPFENAHLIGRKAGRDVVVAKFDHRGEPWQGFGEGGVTRFGLVPGVQDKQQSGHDFGFSLARRGAGWLVAGYTVGASLPLKDRNLAAPGNADEVGDNAAVTGQFYLYKMDGYAMALDASGRLDGSFGNSGLVFLGGSRQEKFYEAVAAADGGWLAVGRSSSFDMGFARGEPAAENMSVVVARLDERGQMAESFGQGGVAFFDGSGDDQGNRVLEGAEGKDIWVLTRSSSREFPFLGDGQADDIGLLRLNERGDLVDRWSFGGSGMDKATGMAWDGERLVIAGLTDSRDGDFPSSGEGDRDLVVIRLTAERAILHERVLDRFAAPEARQGVAVDEDHVYVISNHRIGKYEKGIFKKVASWECPEGRPLTHLNAGIVLDGKLYCAHSNYPEVPMTSSLEVWDTETLAHIDSRSFGPMIGSLTWVDRRNGSWYACFAHYANRAREPDRDPSWTTLVRFSEDWQRQEAWVFPLELVELFGNYSSSGGGFGPDGRLYVTGHDNQALYVLEFPQGGSTLKWVATIPIAAEGQAFAWDPSEPWTLYSIVKRERTVIVSRIEEDERHDREE